MNVIIAREKKRTGPAPGTRPSGRQKGAPNKRSLELLDGLIAQECSPPTEIAALLQDEAMAATERMACWQYLLPYLYPQRKAIDPDGYLTVEQAAAMLRTEMAKVQRVLEVHLDPMQVAVVMEAIRHG